MFLSQNTLQAVNIEMSYMKLSMHMITVVLTLKILHHYQDSQLLLPFCHCKVPLTFYHATAFYPKVENPLQKPPTDNDKAVFSFTGQTPIFIQLRQ